MFRLAVFLVFVSGIAQAGAWPRGQGNVFLSSTIEFQDLSQDITAPTAPFFASNYLEYGLDDRMTLGLELADSTDSGLHGRLFVLHHLEGDEVHRRAYSLSLGRASERPDDTYLGLGLHYGRGFQWQGKNGWLAIDNRLDWNVSSGRSSRNKFDLSLGLTHGNGVATLANLWTTVDDDGFHAKLVPTVSTPVSEALNLDAAAVVDLTDDSSIGLRFGFSARF